MKLRVQKRIAADVLKCSPKRVVFDTAKLKEIKEGITKSDIRGMIIDNFISKRRIKGISNARSKKIKVQKTKGRQKGHGSRKGKKNARTPKKELWMNKVRLQRNFLRILKEKNAIENKIYWDLYRKIKGGFFRSKRHLQLYITEKKLAKEPQEKQTSKSEKTVKTAAEKEKQKPVAKKTTKKVAKK